MSGLYDVDPIDHLTSVVVPDHRQRSPELNLRRLPSAAECDGHEPAMFRWGLVPGWAPDLAIGAKMINARAENIAEKPAYRSAFKKRRCLILADGFYE